MVFGDKQGDTQMAYKGMAIDIAAFRVLLEDPETHSGVRWLPHNISRTRMAMTQRCEGPWIGCPMPTSPSVHVGRWRY